MTSTRNQPVHYYMWSILYNVGPKLKQHWICVFYLCYCGLAFVQDQDTSNLCKVIVTTSLCLMLGHHLRLWIDMNPSAGSSFFPVNTRRWDNVGLMLGQRRRRWANIKPTLSQRFVFAGLLVWTIHLPNIGLTLVNCLRHRPNIRKTLGRCRPIMFTLWDWQWWIKCMSIVYDAGQT